MLLSSGSNTLERLKFKVEKIIGIEKPTEKVRKNGGLTGHSVKH